MKLTMIETPGYMACTVCHCLMTCSTENAEIFETGIAKFRCTTTNCSQYERDIPVHLKFHNYEDGKD